MKTKFSKQLPAVAGYSSDLAKVAIVALLVTILLIGALNLFSMLLSKLFN